MGVGSIVIKHNPVTLWERFILTLSPEEAKFNNYQQEDRDGGYYRASFNVFFDPVASAEFLENGLGRHIEVYDTQSILAFEGFIFEIVRDAGGTLSSVSLQNTINRMVMRADYDDDQVVERGTTLSNTESQAKYGIKDGVLSGGELSSLSVADQTAQQYLDWRAFPNPEPDIGAGSNVPHVEIYCRGYIETLMWRLYNQTILTGNQAADDQISDMLDSAGQFVKNKKLTANSTLVTKEYDADRRLLDIIYGIAALGDSRYNRWIAYMKEDRTFYYEQAAPTVLFG
jgi:hypothetical protein